MKIDAPARKRILAGGENGLDVQAVQRGLARALGAASSHMTRDGGFDLTTTSDLRMFQRLRGIPASGSMGQPTLDALWPLIDAYGQSLYYRARIGQAPELPAGVLVLGAHGARVRAAEQMLWRALGDSSVNLRNGIYGDGLAADVREFLHRADLKGDGDSITPAVWAMLYGFADPYARAIAAGAVTPVVAILRSNLVTWAEWYVRQVGTRYVQVRPYQRDDPPRLPLRNDCSGSVSHLFRLAGLPDPSRNEYDGTGYTGTMQHAGVRVELPHAGSAGLSAADLILYGHDDDGEPVHVAVVLDQGRLFTFGSNPPTITTYARYWPQGRRHDIGARRLIP